MGFTKQHWRKLVPISGIIFLYFATRLYNIISLPIFTDEAIYTRWSQIAKNDANWRFISLTDGKQPMFVWLDMTVMRLVSDPLLAGRLVSVFAGFVAMVGLFFLGRELFKNWKVGLIASFLYIVFPFALMYDRMALYESLVSMFMVWALYLEILLVRTIRLDVALVLGMVIGGAVLTKSNAFFAVALLPFSLLLFEFQHPEWKKKLIEWVLLATLATIMSFGFYSILRLSPFFHIIKDKNALFAYPFNEWIEHPFLYLLSNLRGLFDWLLVYFTWPLFVMIFLAFLLTMQNIRQLLLNIKIIAPLIALLLFAGAFVYLMGSVKMLPVFMPFFAGILLVGCIGLSLFKNRFELGEKLLLIAWFLIPFAYLAFFGNTIYPRFILFMSLPLVILASYSIVHIFQIVKSRVVIYGICAVLLILPLRADYFVLSDIANAPLPRADLDQYINTWPAGGGMREVVAYLNDQAMSHKIYVATEGTFGLMPYSLEIYLGDNPNVKIVGFWPVNDTPPKEMIEASHVMPTYVVFYQPCNACRTRGEAPQQWPLTLVAKYQKGIGKWNTYLYQVRSEHL